MKTILKTIASSLLMLGLLASCAKPVMSERTVELRNKLTQLQNNPKLKGYAPEALREAEEAVKNVETPQESTRMTMHLDYVAHRKIEIAQAKAQAEYLEAERVALLKLPVIAGAKTTPPLQGLVAPKGEMGKGSVVTLGDLLFDTGKANLKPAANDDLNKLVQYLRSNPESKVLIQGHADSVGSEQSNVVLSQNRAGSVKAHLQGKGIEAERLMTRGEGESTPVADNNSAPGRQLNRRVEVTIVE